MRTFKSISKQLLSLIAVLFLTTLDLQNISAHTTDTSFSLNQTGFQFAVENESANTSSPFTLMNSQIYSPPTMGIKIIIIIIIKKKKKKGLVEVVGTRLAKNGKHTRLKENEVLAEATRDGNSFIIMPLKGVYANSEYGFPPSFKVSKEVSAKLGVKVPFGLKATRIQMGVNKMGNSKMKDLESQDKMSNIKIK
ncbi:MAG: hypothetical protein ACPG49_01090 [Chitinophagales bacterium]